MIEYTEKKQLPPFLSEPEKERFLQARNTHFIVPEVVKTSSVFVTYSGLCFKTFHFYEESSYRYAYHSYKYKLQCAFNFFTKKRLGIKLKAFFVHTSWSTINYHHWLVDCLPRFYPFLPVLHDYILILPSQLKDVPFVKESLNLLRIKKVCYFSQEELVKASTLDFAEQTPGNFYVNNDLKPIVEVLKKNYEPSSPYKKILLSRQNIGYRTIENFEEVKSLVQKFGFEVMEADSLSFSEQVSLFQETKYLLSVHGAGLTNCIFMQAGGSVIELHPDIELSERIFNYIYWNLAKHFNLNYYFLGCRPTSLYEKFHTANLWVDCKKLEKILNSTVS